MRLAAEARRISHWKIFAKLEYTAQQQNHSPYGRLLTLKKKQRPVRWPCCPTLLMDPAKELQTLQSVHSSLAAVNRMIGALRESLGTNLIKFHFTCLDKDLETVSENYRTTAQVASNWATFMSSGGSKEQPKK
jgi:hypothetical protein